MVPDKLCSITIWRPCSTRGRGISRVRNPHVRQPISNCQPGFQRRPLEPALWERALCGWRSLPSVTQWHFCPRWRSSYCAAIPPPTRAVYRVRTSREVRDAIALICYTCKRSIFRSGRRFRDLNRGAVITQSIYASTKLCRSDV